MVVCGSSYCSYEEATSNIYNATILQQLLYLITKVEIIYD